MGKQQDSSYSNIIGVENTTGYKDTTVVRGSGAGLRLVADRIEIFNKTFNNEISMKLETKLLHCKSGYRIEVRFNL